MNLTREQHEKMNTEEDNKLSTRQNDCSLKCKIKTVKLTI